MTAITYRLKRANKVVRIGKGTVSEATPEKVESYLNRRGYTNYSAFDYRTHSSESAAFKEEKRLLDRHVERTGSLPSRNERSGGGGGRTSRRCKAMTSYGDRCDNSARDGNYGFCGVHR